MSDLTPLSGDAGYAEAGPERLVESIEADYEQRLDAFFAAPVGDRRESYAVLVGLTAMPNTVDLTLLHPGKYASGEGAESAEGALSSARADFGDGLISDPKVYIARVTSTHDASIINSMTYHDLSR